MGRGVLGPPNHLIRRLAQVPPEDQFTTSIALGELLYGASKRVSPELAARVRAALDARVGAP
jgi:predicted nucleic acid-binding protein